MFFDLFEKHFAKLLCVQVILSIDLPKKIHYNTNMNWYTQETSSILEHFASSESGLTTSLAEQNRTVFGKNELPPPERAGFFVRLGEALRDPMLIILIVALVITIGVNIAEYVMHGTAEFIEAVGIFAAIILSVAITMFMETKSQNAFDALKKMGSTEVKVLRDGNTVILPSELLACGDIVLLAQGDRIAADGRLIFTVGFSCDESALTGESVEAEKRVCVLEEATPLAERENTVYSGCFVTAGNGVMIVTEVGQSTEIGKIAEEISTGDKTSPLTEKLGRLGKQITLVGALFAVAIFILQIIRLLSAGQADFTSISAVFITSIVLIVAAVPEGLPTIVAVCLSLNVIKMAKSNALVKKLVACETIGSVNVICSDKTGTLTMNKMTVTGVFAPERCENSPEYIALNSSINSTADLGPSGEYIGSSTECALLAHLFAQQIDFRKIRAEESVVAGFPFSSDEKKMTTIIAAPTGFLALTKGGAEIVLSHCTSAVIDGAEVPLNESLREKLENSISALQKQGLRAIGFAHAELPKVFENREEVERAMVFDGVAAIIDPLRPDVLDAVITSHKAGIGVKMLTGDNALTARYIATQLGIIGENQRVVVASEIENMDDEQLALELPNIAVIARSTPTLKMRVVRILKNLGYVVAVTGDGINDAPALKHADIGIAMGITGTEVSKEAADMVLLDDAFSTIVRAVAWGRGIFENFQRFIQFQLTVNVASVMTVLLFVMLGYAAPFTALQLLWVNIIMDGPPAITLGLEPPAKNLMDRRPVARRASVITGQMMGGIIGGGAVIIALMSWQRIAPASFIGGSEPEQASILFALFSILALVNALNCRAQANSIFTGFFANKALLIALISVIIIQIVIVQFAGAVFSTVPLSFEIWLKIFAAAVAFLAIFEFGKLVMRSAGRK